MKIRFLPVLIFLGVFIFSGCSGNSNVNPEPQGKDLVAEVALKLTNLKKITNGHYEGWLLADGQTTSFGKFNLNEDGKIIDLAGNVIEDGKFDVQYHASQEASRVLVTVEDADDNNDQRSTTVVLEGNISPLNQSDLYFAAYDTESMSGAYELRTYSAENNDIMAANGLWFSTVDEEKKRRPLLDMPDSKQGWIYEAWIQRGDSFLSLGKFGSVMSSDMGKKFARDGAVLPSFPGEDLLVGKDEFSGINMPFKVNEKPGRVFVTLEPFSDRAIDLSGQGPYSIVLLEAQISPRTTTKEPHDLINVALNNVPAGSVMYLPGKITN